MKGREWVALMDGGPGKVTPWQAGPATSSPALAPRRAQPKCGCTPAMCQEARRSKTTLKAAESSLAPRPFLRESACRLLALSPTLRGHWFCISVAQQASSVLLGPRLFERHSR